MRFPPEFLDRMQAELGTEYLDFLAALEQPAPVSIRLNPAKTSSAFANATPIPWHPDGRYLDERPSFTLDPLFHAGAYYVQEASSMLIFEALHQTVDLGENLRALDLCAAPGGKTTLLRSAFSPDSFLVANEVIQNRIAPLKMNLEKWGHANVAATNHDPEDFERLAGFFDVVLVDAPCSGEGLFRKDEDAAGHWSPESVQACAARQRRILTAAAGLVKQGGVLLYSTCTFNASENEDNVRWLSEEMGFEFCPLTLAENWGVVEKKWGYQCYPHRVRGEGFFLAALRKTGDVQSQNLKTIPPKDWQRFPEKQLGIFDGWLAQAADNEFFTKPDGVVMAVPKVASEAFFAVGNALKKRSLGLEMGELKNKDFIPSHTLALSNALHPVLPKAELAKEQALLFLKKENIWEQGWPRGWTLASYENLPLGWMKVLDNRINNYLPTNWRIRMDLRG